jgi:hypothetical protein
MNTNINFFQGQNDLLKDIPDDKKLDHIKERCSEFFNVKNLHFLLGSGASNGAVPTMVELFKKVQLEIDKKDTLKKVFYKFKDHIQKSNLEEILGALYAHRSYCRSVKIMLVETLRLIELIEEIIFNEINISFSEDNHLEVLKYYQKFYQKVALRSRDLSRINIFTTNNDLMNEKALDRLNINYINGFSGGIDKYFNPALFNYTFSKRMDTSIEKFEPVENMIYLYKLHGSVNWIEDEKELNTFFNIKEIFGAIKGENNVLIYPNPLKQNKSLGSPYSDLFREFQGKLLEPHSVLFTIGYGFNDEHVNNIIYQALATNSAINVVILNEAKEKKIAMIDDNRIFKLSGELDGKKIHYFDFFINEILPDLNSFKESTSIEDFIDSLRKMKNENR